MSAEAIKKLCAVLARHNEVIGKAYLDTRNVIPLHEEGNDAAITALLAQRLAWHLDEDEGVRLSTKLVALLDQAVRADWQLNSSNSVAIYWRDLNACLQDYNVSSTPADTEMTRRALQECAARLIEEIRSAIGQFGRFIERGYAYAQSSEIRLQQNERTLARAKELVEMMESCDLTDYQRAAGTNQDLRTLFYRHLPKAFEHALKELRRILGDLQTMLTKIREEQTKALLLRTFQNTYERTPGFMPAEPAMLNGVISHFNIAEPLLAPAEPNIYHRGHEEQLVGIVQSLGIQKQNQPSGMPVAAAEIDNVTTQIAEAPEADPLFEAAEACLMWLEESGQTAKAGELYHSLEIKEPYDLWLYALLNYVQGMPKHDYERVSIQYTDHHDDVLTGFRTVKDLTLSMVASPA